MIMLGVLRDTSATSLPQGGVRYCSDSRPSRSPCPLSLACPGTLLLYYRCERGHKVLGATRESHSTSPRRSATRLPALSSSQTLWLCVPASRRVCLSRGTGVRACEYGNKTQSKAASPKRAIFASDGEVPRERRQSEVRFGRGPVDEKFSGSCIVASRNGLLHNDETNAT